MSRLFTVKVRKTGFLLKLLSDINDAYNEATYSFVNNIITPEVN